MTSHFSIDKDNSFVITSTSFIYCNQNGRGKVSLSGNPKMPTYKKYPIMYRLRPIITRAVKSGTGSLDLSKFSGLKPKESSLVVSDGVCVDIIVPSLSSSLVSSASCSIADASLSFVAASWVSTRHDCNESAETLSFTILMLVANGCCWCDIDTIFLRVGGSLVVKALAKENCSTCSHDNKHNQRHQFSLNRNERDVIIRCKSLSKC